jgi:phage terminase Nu1 subunit (DNA packaging protein)
MATLPLPKLPTDNLYKFVALTGLSLIALAVYLTGRTIDSLSERLAPVARKTSLVTHNSAQLERAVVAARNNIADLNKATDDLRAELGAVVDDPTLTVAQKKTRVLEMKKKNGELRERASGLEHETKGYGIEADVVDDLLAESAADLEAAKVFKDSSDWIQRLSWVMYLVGAACAAWGFAFWYLKVQKFQDKELAEGRVEGQRG